MRWAVITVLYLVASVGMTLLTSALHFDRDPRSCLAAMLDGSAHRPFVTRRLVPDVIGGLTRWTPQKWQTRIVHRFEQLPAPLPRLLLGRNPQVAFAHFLLALSVWGCYFGVLWLWRGLLHGVQTGLTGQTISGMLPLVGLALVYPLLNWQHGVHLYDPATLLLYSTALWALLRQNIWLYWLTFALATWHKETAILLLVWWLVRFALTPYPSPRGRGEAIGWGVAAAMLLLYLAVRLWLSWLYRENPGSVFEFWLTRYNLPFLEAMFTEFGWRHARFLLILAIAIGLPAWGWRRKSLVLRRMMLAGLAIMGIPWLFFGILDEFRALLELYPLWLMLCVPGGYSLPSRIATEPSGMVNRS